eukprot:CAMPEP_0202696062 /NCGR_PEP_ID=MMETSP1385-20130828/9436_1 /ASSEMBLY_ACC=CAM_ASM_000861 /TAXON_ID=933848 /ORGANISM="Elphidium margaritaceum" /LENGTH=184 /DNA_ID=CAMNT_0049352165 /DNA_START=99 /DNA_END=653 /DNA_ORIENTATION=-
MFLPFYAAIWLIQIKSAHSAALDSFDSNTETGNGFWESEAQGGCSVSIGVGMTEEECAQECLDRGDSCGGFEVWLPGIDIQGHCYVFNKPLDELNDFNCVRFHANVDCKKYDRKENTCSCSGSVEPGTSFDFELRTPRSLLFAALLTVTVVLSTINIVFMAYANCCKARSKGYKAVKYADTETD